LVDAAQNIDNLSLAIKNLIAGIQNLQRGTHAGTVMAGSAIMEHLVEELLLAYMSPLPKKQRERLFEGYGPLSTFAAKTDVARALKLIPSTMFEALTSLRRLRNKIAHSTQKLDLSHPEIQPLYDKFAGHRAQPSARDANGFMDCIHEVGVSLGGYIADVGRTKKSGLGPFA
jgi:hypothetical protein